VDEKTGLIENESSIDRIAAISLSFAKAGADIVAPSDMMDGRVVRIKQVLRKAKLENKVTTKPWKISKLYALFP
jgi:porphobilinogen synthase